MRLRHTRSAAALAALGLTATAAVIALGPSAPAGTTAAAAAGSVVPAPGAAGLASAPSAASLSDGSTDFRHELELTGLSARAAEREEAVERAGEASALLESIKAARAGAVEQATRGAERARLATASPRELGQILAADRGFIGDEWSCLDSLWQRESNWNPSAQNPSSGAYGIPQSLPGSKMATVASDWRTNPATQISWGLNYIVDRYGSPCGAWGHSQSVGWY